MANWLDRLTREQLRLIGGSLLLLLVVALGSYVVLPEFRALRAASSSLKLLEASTQTGPDIGAQLSSLIAEIEQLERDLHGDMATLPVNQIEAYIIGRLQRISWQFDIEFLGVEPSYGGIVGEFQELLFDVELRGNYFDLFDWLRGVSRELGFVVVKRFQISPSVNSGPSANSGVNTPEVQIDLTMASYRSLENR